AYDIVRSILNDSIINRSELRSWLDNIGGKRADEQIIASYLSEGNYTDAMALANMMPALYDYTDGEVAEHNYYMEMLNLQISLAQQAKSIFELDSSEINNLVYMADNRHGTAGTQAKSILEYAYGYNYCNCISDNEAGYKSSNALNPDSFTQLLGIEITVEPNPATDWAVFNYTLPDNNAEGEMMISDATGKLVATISVSGKQGQKIWDTRKIKSGVYFYTLNVSGFHKTGKIVVKK
ncbi:MAG: T9SS type A sorting domain-containing protein, partial [Bacteroidales bacterium]|nr:T9SS type A sorting domain-containing protein [Bacteroidales bacterium]